jgi:hypothetical protein
MKLEGKRKLVGYLVLIGLSACMVFCDKIGAQVWATISITAYGILCGGNAWEHWKEKNGTDK